MAYQALLINRLAQFGKVSYDLVVTDDAGLLPVYRAAVSWLIANDTAAKAAILSTSATTVTALRRDGEIAENLITALDQRPVTFRYSTASENVTAVRALFKQLSGWDAVRLMNYISSLGLSDTQYTNFFGYSGAALTTFKAKLAAAVTNYNNTVATQGQ